ncbi:MAG: phosphatase PAP2 family protein [Fidelibacterota bacterium]
MPFKNTRASAALFLKEDTVKTSGQISLTAEFFQSIEDIKHMGKSLLSLDKRKLYYVTGAFSSIAMLMVFDADIRGVVVRNKSESIGKISGVDELVNSSILFPASYIFYFAGYIKNDNKLKDAAFVSFESMLITINATALIKKIMGRRRPASNGDQWEFNAFSRNYSFPSGHTSAAFSFFSVWASYYGRPYSYLFYLMAAFTGWSRIYKDVHWASDVVAGALLGTLVGRTLSEHHINKHFSGSIGRINGEGFAFSLSFNINKFFFIPD